MYTIRKEFNFSASHQLEGLQPEDHPCMRVHGHNYVVTVEMRSPFLNPQDFVLDYREMEPIKKYLDSTFDHRHLNDVMIPQPSAENIARVIFDYCKTRYPMLFAVEVSETPKTTARYEQDFAIKG